MGKMNTIQATVLILLVAVAAVHAEWEPKEFEYYEIILEREPFGSPPENPPPEPPPTEQNIKPQGQSFARNLRLTALWEIEGVGVRVGIMDLQSKQNYTLAIGQSAEGMELVSADYDKAEAVVRKGNEHAQLQLDTEGSRAISANEARETSPSKMLQRNSYIERRKARRERYTRPKPEQPKYTGAELKKRLQEVQMDAIRTGKPPLPIPLTPEMDEQLVKEGVLPPVED